MDDPDEESRSADLAKRYPNPGDPRRDPDFGTRRTDFETKQVLLAILDELQAIRAALPTTPERT
jgi:hypothetical protein